MTNYPPPVPHQEPEDYNYNVGNVSVFIDKNDDGGFDWEAVIVEQVIVGPYPGSPDTNEQVIGEGTEDTLIEAQWKAGRAIERYQIREEVEIAEEEELYNGMEQPDED